MTPWTGCLFCGGNATEPDHLKRCDGRQGRIETPGSVKDPVAARRVTERGIAQADSAARDDYRATLDEGVEQTARLRREFVSDDVWDTLGAERMRAGNPSALGAALRRAAKAGLIQLQGTREDSQRPTMHCKPLRVWRSLIAQAQDGEA